MLGFRAKSEMSKITTPKLMLLDIEGTMAPVSFVYETLFPYASKEIPQFLAKNYQTPEIREAFSLLLEENSEDVKSCSGCPQLEESAKSLSDYCLWLMAQDRKSRGLKIIQGLIWKDGYERGILKAELYSDVLPALQRWRQEGRKLCIYSSGSILAQKLLFAHTSEGDLRGLFDEFFDTSSGGKKDSTSYKTIADAINTTPAEIFFLSDCGDEIKAAAKAGCQVQQVARESHLPNSIASFDDLT